MRRKDREVIDIAEIFEIIKKCNCCRLAFFDEEYPYIVPMNFGASFDNNKIVLYFHCANKGKKLDLINVNSNVSFEMDCSHKLITGDIACDYSMEYESVMGNGVVSFINENKVEALTLLMKSYSKRKDFAFSEKELSAVTIFKIEVVNITGKKFKK